MAYNYCGSQISAHERANDTILLPLDAYERVWQPKQGHTISGNNISIVGSVMNVNASR